MLVNNAFGWVWIFAGFLAGMGLGLRFHREAWLGGYGSHARRMLRLGHISFVGLGIVNILFAMSVPRLNLGPPLARAASAALIAGAVTMPLCCALMAWRRALWPLFTLPVTSLLVGAALVVIGVVRA
jgi:hypothetical protein